MLKLAVFNSINYSFNKKTWVSDMANLASFQILLALQISTMQSLIFEVCLFDQSVVFVCKWPVCLCFSDHCVCVFYWLACCFCVLWPECCVCVYWPLCVCVWVTRVLCCSEPLPQPPLSSLWPLHTDGDWSWQVEGPNATTPT